MQPGLSAAFPLVAVLKQVSAADPDPRPTGLVDRGREVLLEWSYFDHSNNTSRSQSRWSRRSDQGQWGSLVGTTSSTM